MTTTSAPIMLSAPIHGPSTEITHVVLRRPGPGMLNEVVTDIDKRRWNLAHILDLPLSAILQLDENDIEMIDREWRAFAERSNLSRADAAAISHPNRKDIQNGR